VIGLSYLPAIAHGLYSLCYTVQVFGEQFGTLGVDVHVFAVRCCLLRHCCRVSSIFGCRVLVDVTCDAEL